VKEVTGTGVLKAQEKARSACLFSQVAKTYKGVI
jgi:hypothetical protein